MQRLVLVYNWCVPYEASGTETIPFEYASKEDAYVDFMTAFESTQQRGDYNFKWLDRDWTPESDLPDTVRFFTIDEWFNRYKISPPKN